MSAIAQVLAGCPASASSPTETTLYALASDGQISSTDDGGDVYATARDGTGTLTPATGGTTANAGQRYIAGTTTYLVYEAFFNFDLLAAGISAGANVSAAVLSFWLVTDGSVTDFTAEARTQNWGDTLTTADWVPGADLAGKTLLASLTTAGLSTGAYFNLIESGTNLQTAIETALAGDGILRMVVCSSRTTGNNAPTGIELIALSSTNEAGTTQDPKLVVTWT